MEHILEILDKDCRVTPEQIALMIDADPAEVAQTIRRYEDEKVIMGYKPLINWEKTSRQYVDAFIELRVTPQIGQGFDKIAEKIYGYEMVRSVYLMSGGFDLAVFVEGGTLKEVSLFVSEKLATMDAVISTATHFVLKKYKDNGVVFSQDSGDERRVITL